MKMEVINVREINVNPFGGGNGGIQMNYGDEL
jgi:hypothetical protein